jgi:preprotein translocase subunit SecF
MKLFENPNINFVRWRWHAIALSWLIIVAGLVVVWKWGMPRGVEFSGGTIVIVKFEKPADIEQVRTALDRAMPGMGQNSIVNRYGDDASNQVMIRVPNVGSESSLSQTADAVVAALKQSNLGGFSVAGTEIVGPIVGEQLTRQGTLATILALAGILVYIAMRFQFSFALGAVVATIHDLLVTLAFLAFFRYDLSLNVIAAILTITGYSVQDTIVIFDRVRENMKSMRRDNLEHVVNVAVNQTLSRTVITAGLTLLSVVALYLFGGEVLRGFSFTMLVGVITGTYSSVFIAAAIVIFWQGRKPTRGQAAPATTAAGVRKPGRRRAS